MNWISSGEYVINQKNENNLSALNEHFENNTGKEITDQLRTSLIHFLQMKKK